MRACEDFKDQGGGDHDKFVLCIELHKSQM